MARTGDARLADAALVVGFDLDGFAFRPERTPYVVCLKGVMADEMRFERGRPRLRFRLLSHLEGANARSADVVMVTSEHSRGVALEAYGLDPTRVKAVPEGIEIERWSDPAEAADKPVGAETVILSVARQYRRKNTIALLRAMPSILEAAPSTRLRIVGGGPELQHLVRARQSLGLAESVVITGELPDADGIRNEYRAADIFCLPSLQEGFGIAFLEAMASGLPIVACRSSAVPEVVPEGKAGLLVPPDDPLALEGALVRLLRDPPLRRRMGEAGRRIAGEHGWDRIARLFLSAVGF